MDEELKRIFIKCLEELDEEYPFKEEEKRFFTERDIVWAVQKKLMTKLKSPYKVFNDYSIPLKESTTKKFADLVIINKHDESDIKIIAEFKYEPNKKRKYPDENDGDIKSGKFPLTSPSLIYKDEEKLNEILNEHKGAIGFLVFIDEGIKYDNKVVYKPHDGDEKSILFEKEHNKKVKYKIFPVR